MSLLSTSDLKPVVVSTNNSFLALKSDGTLVAWGKSGVATSSLPSAITNSGFIDIASTDLAFAALNSNGTVISWGKMLNSDGNAEDISNVPTDDDFVRIYSNQHAFAAQKKNGKAKAWGRPGYGGPIYNSSGTDTTLGISSHFYLEVKPYKNGFYGRRYRSQTTTETYAWGKSMNQNVQTNYRNNMWAGIGMISKPGTTGAGATRSTTVIQYPSKVAFNDEAVAIIYSEGPSSSETTSKNGSIAIGGASDHGGLDSTIDFNSNSAKRLYENIYTTQKAFAALNKDGSIVSWGDSDFGGTDAPTGTGYSKIYSTNSAFAALKSDGSISVWGDSSKGGSRAPTGTGFTKIFSTATAFAAIKSDGSVSVWGDINNGGSGAPTGTGFTKIFSNETTFVGLNKDGSITAWGGGANSEFGASGAPTSSDILTVIPSQYAFTAIKTDGSVVTWGDDSSNTYLGSASAPSDLTFVTSNFAYKMNGYEMSRWSAIHEINNIEHDLNKVTYYRNVKVNLSNFISNDKIANARLIEGKIGIEHTNIDSTLTYSFQKSINQSDFTDVDVSKLLRFSGNTADKKGYYFDISGAATGMLKLRVISTIDNIKYVRNIVYYSSNLPSYDPSNTYDLSNKTLTRTNGNTFNITNLDSNVDKYMTALVSSNNRDWVWFKPSSNRAAFLLFDIGTQHPLGESYFKMTLGQKYYVKIGLTKTTANVGFNTYAFFDTIEFYYIPNTQFNFTASLTKGNTFMTLDVTHDNSFKDYIKEMQIQFYENSNDIETFTIPKSKTSYTFNNLTNGTTYYVKISPIDLNNKVNNKEISLNVRPDVSWLPAVEMKTNANYDMPDNEVYHQTVYADNYYIQYYNGTTKNLKILKKSGTSWNQVTDPFPSDNLPAFSQFQSRITHFHKSGDYYAYYERPEVDTNNGNIVVYKQGSDGKMTFISRVSTDLKHIGANTNQNHFNSFTMNVVNGTVTLYVNQSKNYVLDSYKFTRTRIIYPASEAESIWKTSGPTIKIINNGTEYSSGGRIYYDYNGNFIIFGGSSSLFPFSSYVYICKNGETPKTLYHTNNFSNPKIYSTKNFMVVSSGNASKRWGWVNFNRSPTSDGEWTTSNTTGAYHFALNTSTAAGFMSKQTTSINSGTFAFGSKYIILPGSGNIIDKIINYSDNTRLSTVPGRNNTTFFPTGYYAKTIANDFYMFSYDAKALGTDSPPATASDEAISNGISESDVEVLEAVTFTADTEDSTKSVPAKTAIDKIKNLMSSIGRDSNLTDKQKVEKKRKQRRSTLKVLFNKSRQIKKMIIPKADLDLPSTFTKEKALVVKAGETIKLKDLADDEGAYTVLDDGEEIIFETANTILTFTRDDNDLENREEYTVSSNTWRDIDGEDIVINTDNVTGTFSIDTKDGYLLPGDTFTIDGQLFFIGSVGTGGSGGGSAGDPYIFPFKSNCPVKLPNKKAFYRIFEQGNNYINIEVNQATENHKKRMLAYAQNITPVTHNIVMDGYFYSKLFISAEGHKLSIDYLTKKASCDEEALSFFRISNSIKRFDCGEFYEDAKCVNIKWRTKENKLIKAQVLFFPNPHIENGINVIPQTLHKSTGLLVDNYKPKLMEIPRLTTEKYGKIQRKLKKCKNIHHKMSIKGKNEKWYFSK